MTTTIEPMTPEQVKAEIARLSQENATLKTGAPVIRDGKYADSVEIVFPDKPSAETRADLKAAGFRFHFVGCFWYGKRDRVPSTIAHNNSAPAAAAARVEVKREAKREHFAPKAKETHRRANNAFEQSRSAAPKPAPKPTSPKPTLKLSSLPKMTDEAIAALRKTYDLI